MRAAIFHYAAIPVFLFGCAGPGSPPGSYLKTYGLSAEPRRASFDVCRSTACEKTGRGLLSEAEWAEVRSPRNEFGPPRTAQLDCIAETSNTTVFLLLLERDGLISRHRVRYPARRGFLIWSSHNTAVLEEVATGRGWAIDSWYGPKGSPTPVWPLDLWQSGKVDQSNCENAADLVPRLLSGMLPFPKHRMLQDGHDMRKGTFKGISRPGRSGDF